MRVAAAFFSVVIFFVALEVGLQVVSPLYRYLYSYTSEKTDGAYTIVVLGESTSYDLSTGNNRSWPNQLNKLLKTTGRYNVISLAQPGLTTTSLLRQLDDLYKSSRPDMVISMMGINDHPHFWYRNLELIKSEKPEFHLKTVKLLNVFLKHKNFEPPPPPENRKPIPVRSDLCYEGAADMVKSIKRTPLKSSKFKKLLKKISTFLKDKSDTDRARFYSYLAYEANMPEAFKNPERNKKSFELYKLSVAYDASIFRSLERALFLAGLTKQNQECKKLVQYALDQKAEITEVSYGRLVMCLPDETEYINEVLKQNNSPYVFDNKKDVPTASNYRGVFNLVTAHDSCWIAMSYPRRDLPEAITQFEGDPRADAHLIPLENKIAFEEALKTSGYEDLFIDNFGGDFGHLSEKGAKLIADTVFNRIQSLKKEKRCGL